METGIHGGVEEVDLLRIGVEDVDCRTVCQRTIGIAEGIKQEVVEGFGIRPMVVHDGHAGAALVSTVVRRVCDAQIRLFAVHQQRYIFASGGIAAHQPMIAQQPDVPLLHKGLGFKRCVLIKVILLNLVLILCEQVSDLRVLKAGQGHIKIHPLQGFDLNPQHFFIPACILCIAVVCQNVGLFLCLGEMIRQHTGYLGEAFLLGSHQPAVTGDHAEIPVDDDRVDEAELPQRGPELHDLICRMGTGIVDIRNQPVDGHQPHVRGSSLAHGLSFPGVQKTLHQIIIGACAAIIDGAVFLYNLINLVPQLVDLLEVLLGHRNEGRSNRSARCGMLGQKAVFGNGLFTLYPAGNAHGVLVNELPRYQLLALALPEPFIGFAVHVLCAEVVAVFLFFQHVFTHGRHVQPFHLRRLGQDRRVSHSAGGDFVSQGIVLSPGADTLSTPGSAILGHLPHHPFRAGLIPRLIVAFSA